MKRHLAVALLATLFALLPAAPAFAAGNRSGHTAAPDPRFSFFVTSVGNGASGGDFGGLAGADAFCTNLATAAGAGGRTWRAYLSTYDENFGLAVAARTRIGPGPWYNFAGQLIALNIDALHANGLAASLALDEHGATVPANAHDILTGTDSQGYLATYSATCFNWTSSADDVYGFVGHADGNGVGQEVPASWNAAHLTSCDQAGMAAVLGQGRLYCFSPDGVTIGVDGERDHRGRAFLAQSVPNPFRGSSLIRFLLTSGGPVDLAVLDLTGRRVRTLVAGPRQAGAWEIAWDGRDDAGRRLSSGVYLYRLETSGETASRKTLLLR
jgi:flagellar hook capping protein FlgD